MASSIPATRFESSPDFDVQFPPLPRTVAEVTDMMAGADDAVDMPRLADLVSADPMVATFVLRRINSAHYSLRRTVDDVRQAVMLLGFQEVCYITLTAGMMQLKEVMASEEQAAIFKEIMKVSIGAAFYAQELTGYLGLPLKAKAFTLGLQHAVGRLVLLYNRPEDYEALWYTTETDFGPRASAEHTIFGMEHAELGAQAAEHWNLPPLIATVIRAYLNPMNLGKQDQRTLALALAVSVTATEQLCLSERDPHLSRGGQRFFTPPTTLHLLGKIEGHKPAKLIKHIRERRALVSSYIDTMLK